MKKVIIGIFAGLVVSVGLVMTIMYFSYNNKEVRLREAITAKIEVNKSSYTKMWEVLNQKAGVTKEYAKNFKEIYPDLIAGRYSNGQGQLMNWIQEHNPNFDTNLYKDLMMSIEAQRESFHSNQVALQDLSRQHNSLLKTIPSKWFLSSVEPIDVPNVINDEAEKAFETGKEVKMNLFE